MGKITKKAMTKLGGIVEIVMAILNCNYTMAFLLVANSETGKAIIEGDGATMYQSAVCCVEDIGNELHRRNSEYARYFSDGNINKAIRLIRQQNQRNIQRYNQMIV